MANVRIFFLTIPLSVCQTEIRMISFMTYKGGLTMNSYNHIAMLLLVGLSASGAYAADERYITNPYESMNPWTPTKGELKIRKKRLAAANRRFDAVHEKLMATPATDAQYGTVLDEWGAFEGQTNSCILEPLECTL